MNLSFGRVHTWADALALLDVRNSCREGMTHSTEEISEQAQQRFWMDQLVVDNPRYEAYLLKDGTTPLGYGLIKRDGEVGWMTAGLVPAVRGGGLSRILIALITQMGYTSCKEIWIDVWDDNLALRGDIREGYEFVESNILNSRLLHVMKHRRNRQIGSAEANRLGEEPYDIAQEMVEVDGIARAVG